MLLEQQRMPRYKVCGCCIRQSALDRLEQHGVDLSNQTLPLTTCQLRFNERSVELPFPHGATVSREVLDTAILDRAARWGARILPEARVYAVAESGSGSRLVRYRRDRHEFSVHAAVVLLAGGLQDKLLAQVGIATRSGRHTRLGFGTPIPVARASSLPPLQIRILDDGYVGLARLADGSGVLAGAAPLPFVRRHIDRLSRELALDRREFRGTPCLFRKASQVWFSRGFVLGDTASYVEPLTGEGISWALRSAELAIPFAAEAAQTWSDALGVAFQRAYRRNIVRRQRQAAILHYLLHSPLLLRVVAPLIAHYPQLPAHLLLHERLDS
jgi:flavin-dependent dehydrogenase